MFRKEDLEDMLTLCEGHFDNLKFDNGKVRIWLSRVDDSISMERYNEESGRWEMMED